MLFDSSTPGGEPNSPKLGYGHITGREGSCAELTALPGGWIVKREGQQGPQCGGGKRGQIYGFSESAQRRMMDRMMGVPWQDMPEGCAFFVSLTWHYRYTDRGSVEGRSAELLSDSSRFVASQPELLPVDWCECDPPRWHEQLKALRRRMERFYGDRLVSVIWKKEFQSRGAPHYHLVLFFRPGRAPDLDCLQVWMSRAWNEIVEAGDQENLEHGVLVELVRNTSGSRVRALMRYLGKYMAKTFRGCVSVDTGEVLAIGRVWGVWGDLPTAVIGVVHLGWPEFVRLCRRVRRWGSRSRYLSALTAGRCGWRIWYDGYQLLPLLDYLDTGT